LWWLLDQLDRLQLDGLQIDPSHFPGDTPAVLDRLRLVVDAKGYYLEFGMGGWDPTRLKQRIELTASFGGKALRTFVGGEKTTQEELTRFAAMAAPAFREAGAFAEQHGVFIAVENHGDFTAVQLKNLLDRVGHPHVGACLDTGNSLFRHEDPLACAQILAPYTRSMHLKDWTGNYRGDGTLDWKEAIPGEGQIPLTEILRLVARHQSSDLYIALENPVAPSDDEAETVAREWVHLVASAAAGRRIVASVWPSVAASRPAGT
jgi:sugar phosphate isomerase/epimerase